MLIVRFSLVISDSINGKNGLEDTSGRSEPRLTSRARQVAF
jgi:hypothetical protein